MRERFIITAISSNANSFGLHQFVFISQTGEAWAGLANKQYCRHKQDDVITLPENRGIGLAELGFECPHRLDPDAPQEVVDEAWAVSHCDYDHTVHGEVRLLPYGTAGGNMIVCKRHYEQEIKARQEANATRHPRDDQAPTPSWEELEVYEN